MQTLTKLTFICKIFIQEQNKVEYKKAGLLYWRSKGGCDNVIDLRMTRFPFTGFYQVQKRGS